MDQEFIEREDCDGCICAYCPKSCDLCPMWPDHTCPRDYCLKDEEED